MDLKEAYYYFWHVLNKEPNTSPMKIKKRSQMSDMKEFWHSYQHNPTWKLANTISFGTIRKIGGFKVVRTNDLLSLFKSMFPMHPKDCYKTK
jgi:hypothetical protein